MVQLLEREDELGLLAGAAEAAMGGKGSFVLVGGEAGIGKTSLVRAARAELGGAAQFVYGACEPLSVPVPLAAVRQLVDAAGGGDLLASGGEDRLALACSTLRVLRHRAPVVAVVEDAHWADPLTLDLLRILARRAEETGVVFVVTYLDDEVAVILRSSCCLVIWPRVPRCGGFCCARSRTPGWSSWQPEPGLTAPGSRRRPGGTRSWSWRRSPSAVGCRHPSETRFWPGPGV